MSKVHIDEDGCWLWLPSKFTNGYGQASYYGKRRKAHRVVYMTLVGAIPEGLTLDHLCEVKHCVNPEHLEPVTNLVNYRRGDKNARRTHCIHGHPFSGENLYVAPDGHRQCRTCKRKADRESKKRHYPERIAKMRAARILQ